jgi:hypothetical protein
MTIAMNYRGVGRVFVFREFSLLLSAGCERDSESEMASESVVALIVDEMIRRETEEEPLVEARFSRRRARLSASGTEMGFIGKDNIHRRTRSG